MSDVNDDMDELFKRAGENYPLNTDSADWNEVHNALQSLKAPLNSAGNKKRSRKLLWLLLLLPLIAAFVALNKYIFNPVHQNITQENLSKKYKAGTPAQGNINKENPNQTISKETLLAENKIAPPSKIIANKAPVATLRSDVNNDIPVEKYSPGKPLNTRGANVDVSVLNNTSDEEINKDAAINKDAYTNEANINQTTTTIKESDTFKSVNENPGSNSPIEKQENKPFSAADSLKSNSIQKVNKPRSRQKHFYAGIVGGPDLSTVEFQKIIKTGLTAGIIAGYRLNKKWSIESGVYLDKKYYYTKGQYFSTEKVYIPWHTKIENIDGDCYMIELPVNIKFDFKSGKKSNWFALIGSSSYLMKREDYKYRYLAYGQLMENQISSKNSSKNWASVINLGVGYNRNIGKRTMLRVEPYIKIPFKGVGVGSLPITSSGVYLGLTKDLF